MVFFLIYEVLLKRDTFFEANRHFLLSGLTAAFILPLVTITKYIEVQPLTLEDAGSIQLTAALPGTGPGFNWTYLIYTIYIIGLVLFCLKFLFQLLSLKGLIKDQGRKREGGYLLVETKNNIAPFSFFHYIFYNPDLYNATELEAILRHEKAHCSQWHSIDVMLAHLASIFLWMNPLAWLYKKNIRQNLEFLADASAAKEISSIRAYQYTMLKVSGVSLCTLITNTFYNSLIKKRIVMLHKSKSDTSNLLKFILVIPLLILFVFIFNVETKASTIPIGELNALPGQEMSTNDKKAYVITKEMTDEEIASLGREIKNEGGDLIVKKVRRNSAGIITSLRITYKSQHGEVKGNYGETEGIHPIRFGHRQNGGIFMISGGDDAEHTLHTSVHIDEDAGHDVKYNLKQDHDVEIDNNVDADEDVHKEEHKVVIEQTASHKGHQNVWIHSENGNERHIEIEQKNGKKTIRVNGKEVSEAALKDMERNGGLYGKHIKINSSEDEDDNDIFIMMGDDEDHEDIEVIDHKSSGFFFIDTGGDKSPLYIIDGKEASKEALSALSSDDVESIDVSKGEGALKKYGQKARDGVVEITTKQKN